MRYFIFQDTVRRALEFLGYKTEHVMNITDVGHLTSDSDEGEDKMEKGAKREGKTVWEIAENYTQLFLQDIERLNILKPDKLFRATDAIPEIIEIVKALLEKGYAYETPEAIYFDITKFPDYQKLAQQALEEKIAGAREEVVTETTKKHPADFALWFKTVGRFANHVMRWDSPWGQGFPGWHIECSAISRKFLGQPFDIHTGGIDHISVHHPNEIAQSESAFGVPLANYWLHNEFLLVEGQKMSKSLGSLLNLDDIIAAGSSALDFRYLVLTSHYKNRLNFTWEGLGAAKRAFANLKAEIEDYPRATRPDPEYLDKFREALSDNLDTPKALSVLWEIVRVSDLPGGVKRATVNEMDKALGLGLAGIKSKPVPKAVKELVNNREQARLAKDWRQADQIRQEIEDKGYIVEDTERGPKVRKK